MTMSEYELSIVGHDCTGKLPCTKWYRCPHFKRVDALVSKNIAVNAAFYFSGGMEDLLDKELRDECSVAIDNLKKIMLSERCYVTYSSHQSYMRGRHRQLVYSQKMYAKIEADIRSN